MTSATSVKVTYCFLLCYIQNSDNADYRDTSDRVVKDSTDDEIQNVKGGNYVVVFFHPQRHSYAKTHARELWTTKSGDWGYH